MIRLLCLTLILVSTCLLRADPRSNVIPDEELQVLKTPGKATLYSLEPDLGQPEMKDPQYFGYILLGKIEVEGAKEKIVAGEFQRAVNECDGKTGLCFKPRDALEITKDGHTYDYILCYQCHWLHIFKDSKAVAQIPASGTRKFLEDILKGGNVRVSRT